MQVRDQQGQGSGHEERQEYEADGPEDEEHDACGVVEWRARQGGLEHHAGHEPDGAKVVLEQESRSSHVPKGPAASQQHIADNHRLQRKVDNPHTARRGIRWHIVNGTVMRAPLASWASVRRPKTTSMAPMTRAGTAPESRRQTFSPSMLDTRLIVVNALSVTRGT